MKKRKNKTKHKITSDGRNIFKKAKEKIKWQNITRRNKKIIVIVTFLAGVSLIIATYAWFSVSLNVKVKFFNLVVSSDSGLFISLDAVNYSSEVEISMDSVVHKLTATYPNHTNQWSSIGLWPVSTNGIRSPNNDKFDIFVGEVSRKKSKVTGRKSLTTTLEYENVANAANVYIAFDIFLKNVSGSPRSDNLFLDPETYIDFEEGVPEETRDSLSNVMNSMRFGFIRIAHVPSATPARTVQNLKCNNKCQALIYEPNSISHSPLSIERAATYGITLVDGEYTPTYAIIKSGSHLEHTNGHEGTGLDLDTEHFALQETIVDTELENSLFPLPNGVTKLRIYVWIEGQDLDSLETNSIGAPISIVMNLVKDLAGYEEY
ncbi:MAG: hypothetical protein WDA21_05575 [Bacilli bacterium]